MPVIRNPFRKNTHPPPPQSASSTTVDVDPLDNGAVAWPAAALQDDASGSTSAITIVGCADDEKNSYKMSGVWLRSPHFFLFCAKY